MKAIASNAGLSADAILTELKFAAPGSGYDVRQNQVVAWDDTDILDTTNVIQNAAYRAISGAALLLTVDVLVRHKKPETVPNP